jgi:hypothetical protein
MDELVITIKKFIPEELSLVFQQGVILKVRTGVSVRDFLCIGLGLSYEYVEKRISTIFLNGKPIDDLDSAHIDNDSTISLSAAMPGLVGATMRRGGFYASLRNTITYKDEGRSIESEGSVRIKLFNIIMKDVGPDLLRKGIYVSRDDVKQLIEKNPNNFIQNCVSIIKNGKEIDAQKLLAENDLLEYDTVLLKLAPGIN